MSNYRPAVQAPVWWDQLQHGHVPFKFQFESWSDLERGDPSTLYKILDFIKQQSKTLKSNILPLSLIQVGQN